MKHHIKNILVAVLVLTFIILPFSSLFQKAATAATLTSFSDTLTRLKASTAADHEIKFVTAGGLTDGQAITVTFDADFTGLGSIVEDDVDFATGSTNNCSSATFTEQATASSPSGATYGVGISGQVITITSGTGDVTADTCVRIRVGLNATNSGTGSHQISNGVAANDHTVAVDVNSGTDTGTADIDIIANDQVVVTATVNPTISFTVDDNAIGFSTLSSAAATWATADAAGSATDVAANTFTIGTNAPSGYTLTYKGATLTSGGNTIDVANITDDANGTPGTEAFGLDVAITGSGSAASGYDHGGTPDWHFVAGTTTAIASHTAAVAGDSIAIHYLANISAATEPGSYTTTLTYIATGNF